MRVKALLAILLSLFATSTYAQFKASIQGTVTDPQGTVVPGAKVTVTNQSTGAVRETTTSDQGFYRVNELPPGSYTVILRGRNQLAGVALFEIYDLDDSTASRLANISTRAFVQTGDNVLIGGFILGGSDARNVVVRGIGPSLIRIGLTNALTDPTLELRDSDGTLLLANDNWKDNDAQAHQIKILGLGPRDNRESALIATLQPGRYTAIVAGKNGGVGIGLVEIYNIQ